MKKLPILIAFTLSSCVSQVLPPKTPASTLKVDQAIYIKPHQLPAYPESLRAALDGSQVFSKVSTSEVSPTTAHVNRHVYGSTVIPVLTLLSLGIIPTITEEEFGESFLLNYRGKTYGIEATWRGETVLGWAALPLNLSPDRTSGDPEKHPRFYAFLRSRIEESLPRP